MSMINVTKGPNDENALYFEEQVSLSGSYTTTLPPQYKGIGMAPLAAWVNYLDAGSPTPNGQRVWKTSNVTITNYNEQTAALTVSATQANAVLRVKFLVTA